MSMQVVAAIIIFCSYMLAIPALEHSRSMLYKVDEYTDRYWNGYEWVYILYPAYMGVAEAASSDITINDSVEASDTLAWAYNITINDSVDVLINIIANVSTSIGGGAGGGEASLPLVVRYSGERLLIIYVENDTGYDINSRIPVSEVVSEDKVLKVKISRNWKVSVGDDIIMLEGVDGHVLKPGKRLMILKQG